MSEPRKRVVVMHEGYGCDTGCCAHVIYVDDKLVGGFGFTHPYTEDFRQFAENLIAEELGAEHVADLDWENSEVYSD